jgi:uncharacterized membrane protein (DUF373 family)
MTRKTGFSAKIRYLFRDETFMKGIHLVENFVSKVLSLTLVCVIIVSLFDLILILITDTLLSEPIGFFGKELIEVFGLFLNILIALELLENITAYLRKQILQVELVVVTALIAVARKIIIFDPQKYQANDLIAFGIATFALAVSYWLIKRTNN